MKPYLYILVFLECFLLACHSSRKIRIENKTDSPADVVWVIKEDSIHRSPLYTSNSVQPRFHIDNNSPYNKLKMSVGVGSWTPTALMGFVDDLDSMKISWGNKTLKLDTTTMLDYLRVRRKGIGKSQIVIVLK